MELKEPLNNKTLQVVEGLVISPFVNVARSLYILWCVWGPPFIYPHLNFEFQYLTQESVPALLSIPPFRLEAASFR